MLPRSFRKAALQSQPTPPAVNRRNRRIYVRSRRFRRFSRVWRTRRDASANECLSHRCCRTLDLNAPLAIPNARQMLPIGQQNIRKIRESPNLPQPKKQVEVFGPLELGSVTADGQKCISPDRHRGMAQRKPSPQILPINLFVRQALDHLDDGQELFVAKQDSRANHNAVVVRFEIRKFTLEAFGMRDIVRVHAKDVFPARTRNALVQRGDQALVRPGHHAKSDVSRNVLLNDDVRPVRASVVENDRLEIRPRLGAQRVECRADKALGVVNRQDNRYERRHHVCKSRRHERARANLSRGGCKAINGTLPLRGSAPWTAELSDHLAVR